MPPVLPGTLLLHLIFLLDRQSVRERVFLPPFAYSLAGRGRMDSVCGSSPPVIPVILDGEKGTNGLFCSLQNSSP